jgi:Tol biopolymer transport system component
MMCAGITALVSVLALVLLSGHRANGSAGKIRERIMYTALRPANMELYLFDAPAKAPKVLAAHPALDYNPVFSPDGRWIVFCSERRGGPDLYALDLVDPGPPKLLLDSDAMEDAPAFSPDGKQLAFVSDRDGNADVFVMPFRPHGPDASKEAVNVTRSKGGDFNPAFSPDGKQIAFSSDRDVFRESEIYVMQADGSKVRRLTRAPGWDGSPAWSLDGKRIYFYSQRDAAPGIYRMHADGKDQKRIIAGPALSPAVTPGSRIAYAAQQNGRWIALSASEEGKDVRYESDWQHEYFAPAFDPKTGRMISHGTGGPGAGSLVQAPIHGPFLVDDQVAVNLPDRTLELIGVRGTFPTPGPAGTRLAYAEHFERVVISGLDGGAQQSVFEPLRLPVWRPHWSGDGQWIVCAVGPTFGKPSDRVDIWKVRPDGTGAANLTANSGANNGFPYFSPDGKQIVFRSGRDHNHEIYLMNADGTDVRRLTKNPATDTMPSFSPDGKRIAFVSARDRDHELYLLDIDPGGKPGEPRRITHSPGFDTHPVFSPDGQWLAFTSQRGGLNDEEPLIPVFNPQPYGEVYVLRLSDGLVVRLTHNKWEDGTPAWAEGPRSEKGR